MSCTISCYYGLKINGRYVGYNSFEVAPYLTNKEHSEKFCHYRYAENFAKKHNLAARVVEFLTKEYW